MAKKALTTSESVCVPDMTGVGQVCVDGNKFTFSLNDKSKNLLIGELDRRKGGLPPEQKKIAEQQLTRLRSPGGTDSIIPINDVKMVGTFPNKDGTTFLTMALKKDAAKRIGLDAPYTAVHVSAVSMKKLDDAMPRTITRASSARKFVESVKEEIDNR